MALSEIRRQARINALGTVAEYARSMGEEDSDHEDREMSEREHELFIEECQRVYRQLETKINKLIISK